MVTDQSEHLQTLKLKIQGMYCGNCEFLIERAFRKIAGVRKVNVSHATGAAEITYAGDLDISALQAAIEEDGYIVSPWREQDGRSVDRPKNAGREYLEIGAAFLILVGLFLVLKQFGVLPPSFGISDNMSYGLVFLIGLVASVSTCIAVTGGLLVAVAAKYNEVNPELSGVQRFKPHLYFNVGRLLSYALLGGAVGALGSALTLTPGINGLLTIVASLIMIVIGLQMLRLFPTLGWLQPRLPKFLAYKIHDLAARETRGGAFILGASTFFLPCGFTQALQLYVLGKGSFTTGALTMLAFSIGTLPALLSLSAISSFATGAFQRHFLKFAGAAVILLGIFSFQSGLVLTQLGTNSVSVAGGDKPISRPNDQANPGGFGKQVVNMKLVGLEYLPNRFTVKQGVPVEWRINAEEAEGCGRFLIVPKLGIRKLLLPFGTNVIAFTPQQPGEIAFNCGMGMMTPGSKFIVVGHDQSERI